MAKDKVIKPLTEEQRERIRQMPGVVVHRRKLGEKDSEFVPAVRVKQPISVKDLLDEPEYDDDEYDSEP